MDERPTGSAWDPGIHSQIPQELRHLCSIFRAENASLDLNSAMELRGLTGWTLAELAVFRPGRLALHELLIRITANFAVPDGSQIGDLGVNFREIANRIWDRHVLPQMALIERIHAQVRGELRRVVEGALQSLPRHWDPEDIARLESSAARFADPLGACALKNTVRVLSSLFASQGQAWGGRDLIATMAVNAAGNELGGQRIGAYLETLLAQASAAEGYTLLPRQDQPVVINTKGPSASGKSTLRPMQKKLAGDVGVRWSDFALISPDIWRKQLLDYAALGAAYKYAGAFTAEELQIVDQKLDFYMNGKFQRGEMSHLLIDRFRFDSFAPDSEEAGSNLLTRFGHFVYLFFVITPPEMLVERAWKRGLEFGRYKAVDDTLAHAVEAYSGMPEVFFTWIRRTDKRIRFEFLDNTVRLGERPYTAAFGDNDTFNVLQVKVILDIERYARIDVNATAPQGLYPQRDLLRPALNLDFLKGCLTHFRAVNFAAQSTGRIYLRIEGGVPTFRDAAMLIECGDPETLAAVEALAPGALQGEMPPPPAPLYLQGEDGGAAAPTLGQWGRGLR